MRYVVCIGLLLCIGISLQAQLTQGFSYQAVARDAAGSPLTQTTITLQFTIHKTDALGAIAYQESHTTTTNDFGLCALVIGAGSAQVGRFDSIDWAANPHVLVVTLDGTPIDTTQFQAVPYAKVATNMGLSDLSDVTGMPVSGQVLRWNGSAWAPDTSGAGIKYTAGQGIDLSGNVITNTGDLSETNELQILTKSGNLVILSGGGGRFTDEVDDADPDPANEIQTLSLSGSDLSLSNGGGTVTLPTAGGGTYTAGKGIQISGNVITNIGDDDDIIGNEFQEISLAGNLLTLSNGGGTVTLPTGTTYTAGTGIDISGNVISNAGDTSALNEIQTLSLSGSDLSLSNGGGTVTLPTAGGGTYIAGKGIQISGNVITNIGDDDDIIGNEFQEISLAGNLLTLSNGGGTVTLPTGTTYTAGTGIDISGNVIANVGDTDSLNEIQTLSLAGSDLSLSNGGGTVTLPTGGGGITYTAGNGIDINGSVITNTGDADDDPRNELQTISKSAGIIILSNGGGILRDSVEDNDSVIGNELQELSILGNELSLSQGGGTVTLPAGTIYTGGRGIDVMGSVIVNTGDDDANPTNEIQRLALNGTNLTLSNGGGSISLPTGTTYTAGNGINIAGNVIENTGDADANPSNELQQLSLNGTDLTLSDGGGTITLPSGTTYTAGAGINISGTVIENAGDADADPSNELQALRIMGDSLRITGRGGFVRLPSSPWELNQADVYYAGGQVGVGVSNPLADLHVAPDYDVLWGLRPGPVASPIQRRLFYDGSKGALTAGTFTYDPRDSTGINALAFGVQAMAKGGFSVALGNGTYAAGTNSVALNASSRAVGTSSLAAGYVAKATGDFSVALGWGAEATARNSHALGYRTKATQQYALALGEENLASGFHSMATGYHTIASGSNSLTLGEETKAESYTAIAGGYQSEAKGEFAFAFGDSAVAGENYSVAFMERSRAMGELSLAIGQYAYALGDKSVAIGEEARATGLRSMALGYKNVAVGDRSVAIGTLSTANELEAMAFGRGCSAHGIGSLALGNDVSANESFAVAIGLLTRANGYASMAMGIDTEASGRNSIAMGDGVQAFSRGEIALGINNTIYVPNDDDNYHAQDRILVVGNGRNEGGRNDAFTILKSGYIGINKSKPNRLINVENDNLSRHSLNIQHTNTDSAFVGQTAVFVDLTHDVTSTTTGAFPSNGVNAEVFNNGGTATGVRGRAVTNGTGTQAAYGVRAIAENDRGTGIAYALYATLSASTSTGTKYAGYFGGNVFTTGTYLPSDRSLKENLTSSEGTLAKLLQLPILEYTYQQDRYPQMNLPQGTRTGFLAEDVARLMPELVEAATHPAEETEMGERVGEQVDFQAVDYAGMVPYLIKAIQEQQAEIEALKAEVQTLKAQP